MDVATRAIINRALNYPYQRPLRSFIIEFVKSTVTLVEPQLGSVDGESNFLSLLAVSVEGEGEGEGNTQDSTTTALAHLAPTLGSGIAWTLENRTPVVAYGSNAAPEALLRKFGSQAFKHNDAFVPVMKAKCRDMDVVYTAAISSYGSVPAALQCSPGTLCDVCVTFLTPTQLEVMHSTEGGYAWVELPVSHLQYDIHLPFATQRSFYYLAKIGAMTLNGTGNLADQIALAEIPAQNRHFHSMTQREVQKYMMQLVNVNVDLDTFALKTVQSQSARSRNREALWSGAVDVTGPGSPMEESDEW